MVKKEKNVKYYTKNSHSVKCYTIFAMLNKTSKQYEKKEITDEENELLEAIRNYKRAYPNGNDNLLFYARELFERMILQ